ncbi:MAG: hypothetical protein ACI9KE_004236 [Polyangiales bacterium]|jgi:hypothetical protein
MRRWLILFSVIIGCGSSQGPNDDADGDSITNADEGFESGVNTDGDEWEDWLDLDTDGDGFLDRDEAGDSDPSTPPVDTDGDGMPDFRDLDSDNDGIPDWAVFSADPSADNDGDGIPNSEDDDDDGDGIPDVIEGGGVDRDTDGDGLPDRVDNDSDNDGVPDATEGNVDTDEDGTPDFVDTDSDNDGLPDEDEDLNGNGVVDPCEPASVCESDRIDPDTDDDGIDDLVERVAGTDPSDPGSVIPDGDFYFVLPFDGEEQDGLFDFNTLALQKVDVFFSVDTTGSFGEEIAAIQASIDTLIVPGVSAIIGDAAFGVGRFEDFPIEPFGTPTDVPYELLQAVTTDSALLRTAVDALPPAAGGFDTPEAGMEALYQWATGFGIPELDLDPFAPGDVGGAGFRTGALPIVIQITDAASHVPADYAAAGITTHGRDATVAALNANAVRVIGVRSVENAGAEGDPRAELEDLALATRATVPIIGGGCATGIDGASRPAVSVGGEMVCPLVFDVRADGSGLAEVLVDAIAQLIQVGNIDISAAPEGNLAGERGEVLPLGTTTADFIVSVLPEPPAPDGSTIDGDVFRNVAFGSSVTFRVTAQNDFVPSLTVPQLFTVDLNVLGDAVTVLDIKNVYIVVPAVVDGPILL